MKTVYRSKIDWWVWLCLAFMIGVTIPLAIDNPWFGIIFCVGITALYLWLIMGCWYEIDGDNLVVYQFFRPHSFPISKIKSVTKTSSYLATAGMSHCRVSISFVDRSVMKSFAPLEISPKDRDGFISQLKKINPNIE